MFLLVTLPDSWDTFCTTVSNSAALDGLKCADVESSLLMEEVNCKNVEDTKSSNAMNVRGRSHSRGNFEKRATNLRVALVASLDLAKKDSDDKRKGKNASDDREANNLTSYKGKCIVDSKEPKALTHDSDGDICYASNLCPTLLVATNSSYEQDRIVDSGASFHVTPHKEWFSSYECRHGMVSLDNNYACDIIGAGNIKLSLPNGSIFTLTNVRHVPKLTKSLISIDQLDDAGYHTTFGNQSSEDVNGSKSVDSEEDILVVLSDDAQVLNHGQESLVSNSQVLSNQPLTQPEENPTPVQNHPTEHAQPRRGKRASSEDSTTAAKQSSSRFHWDNRSTAILIEVKRAHELERFHAGIGSRSKTLEEQWYEIVATMAGRGVLVDWKAAYDKWKRLVSIHKEISDWERNTPSGKISYWQMSARERTDEGRFGNLNFDRDAYDLMECFYGHDPVTHTPTVSVAAQSDIADDTFEKTPTNGGIAKKACKRTHVHDVGLKEATRDIASALEAAEEAKNVRHKETLDLERAKVEIGIRSAMGLEGLSSALNRIADKM
ncbi:hypothetical protein L7F22_067064 [Adiantum nelumboides]|nr:hypothetical protein [Adiantum nelumboides]